MQRNSSEKQVEDLQSQLDPTLKSVEIDPDALEVSLPSDKSVAWAAKRPMDRLDGPVPDAPASMLRIYSEKTPCSALKPVVPILATLLATEENSRIKPDWRVIIV